MDKAQGAPRGRIPASEESPARKAVLRRGSAVSLLGELGETAFMHKATSLGFGLALPYGHLHRYDFIVESRKQPLARTGENHGLHGGRLVSSVHPSQHPYVIAALHRVRG